MPMASESDTPPDIVLLAELTTVLARHPDRVPALLGKTGIVDDPGLDRPLPLDRRQHYLAHLAQNPLVRPAALTDKMQQHWCCAAVRAGAVTAAIGSTLLRSHGSISPVQ